MLRQKNSDTANGLRLRVAAAAVLAVIAAGCAPDLEFRAPAPNTAQWIQLSHKVAFAPGQASLSPQAARAIDGFVHRAEIAYGDRIVVGPGGGALATQRASVVAAYLRRHRIDATVSPLVPVSVGPNEMAVAIGRYLMVSPDCPQWSSVISGGGINAEGDRYGLALGLGGGMRSDPPLGCVTTSALGAQIADPGDLVDGGRLGPGDGEFMTRGLKRYRADKTKEFNSVKTTKK